MKNSRTQFFKTTPDIASMQISPKSIQEAALLIYNLTEESLFIKSRKAPIPDCKRIICYLISKYTNLTQIEITSYSGSRDRSVVSYYIDTCDSLIHYDRQFAAKVIQIEQRLEGVCA